MAKFLDWSLEEKDEKFYFIAGLKFPLSQFFRPDFIHMALTFKPHPRDVMICSYPKCDSKTVDTIVWKLMYPFARMPPRDCLTNRYLTPIETHGLPEDFLHRKSPRLFKTYLPVHAIPFYRRAKYIYIVRTPWDACISYYRLLQVNPHFTETFEDFFKSFLIGDLAYGCYFKHVSSWIKKLEENNVLILCHEHVKHNPRSAIFTIAAFLGDCNLKQLLHSDDLLKEILKAIGWEKYKSAKKCIKNTSCDPDATSESLSCSKEQVEELITKVTKEIKGTCIEHLWLKLLKKRELITDY